MTNSSLVYLQTESYEAIVEAYALHPTTQDVCLLSITGQPDAIKALRACLSIGIPVTITGNQRLQWPREAETFFTVMQKRMPSGAQAVLWLPQHGTTVGMQHDTRAFIIERRPNLTTMPENFVHIVDRVLPCPIVSAWGPQLWHAALEYHWIRPLVTYNCSMWEFLPKTDEVIAWIHQHLKKRILPIPPEAATDAA